ncbi:aromatic aldehyde oxidoreductase molybdenum-binding subunit [Cystobacter fuscus]|uniref:Aromatic aldehyde oxidoreductase molybdenum-binding subunit n=1 Tax=Cystobacter fuscus TaxID=43 RepID=A0A250J584_9BACT|nr:xanthine dehydrogenase family protein molybdopterin-binding subunit [Cystobacter fuscus]ATB38688.1 aromatic aldehyde oxidoreductase molybdenum-binding subunit [Cystobacter fuscus]
MSAHTSHPDIPRVDARDKVRGATRYAADHVIPGLAHAWLAVATIGRGRLTSLDTEAALAVPGVRRVLTHLDTVGLRSAGFLMNGGYSVQSLQPLLDTAIAHRGQPIALVVADTLEAAREGAALVRATYEQEPHSVTMDAPGAEILPQADSPLPKPAYADKVVGDADGALSTAAVRVDTTFRGPPQHQNPMELLATVAEWSDGALTVCDPTQNAEAVRHGLARVFGLSPDKIKVFSPTLGGGFGQKNAMQAHTPLVALAARELGRPVKLVLTRAQIYDIASFRPASRHTVRLGADVSGRMVAAVHEADHQTSRHDLFPLSYAEVTSRLYGIANFRGHERLIRNDIQTPGYARAPFEHIAACAFETAVDELAYELGQDPVAFRIANDTSVDALSGQPLSSRHVVECLNRGAARFGWEKRSPAPGSMTLADGTLVGWGVAIGAYKAATAPAIARLRVTDAGAIHVSVGGHEMGQGIRTAIAATVAAELGVPPETVNVSVGNTGGVPQHLTAGSWGTATVLPTVHQAASNLMKELRQLEGNGPAGRTPQQLLRDAGKPFLEVEARHRAPGQPEAIFDRLSQGLPSAVGPVYPDYVSFSYCAHFVEVRIEPRTRRIRVPRVVSVLDCGRVISPRTARSQVFGGVIWGLGAALREESEVDPRYGGFLNADLAEYAIPVHADIGSLEAEFIDEPDPLINELGVKGLGEVVMVGVAPAIVNAIHHATGRRIRHLPIRIEDVL